MKRKNKILVGCLALLLTLSVGYALFSDTITINGTATAKGSFDITAICETGISSKLGTGESLGVYTEGGYENDTCSVVDDTVSFSTDFLYPGARRDFTVKMTNTGTIDAVYDDTKTTVSYEICVADNKAGENQECKTSTINGGDAVYVGDYKGGFSSLFISMEDPNGNLLSEEEYMEFIIDVENGIFILKPGYSVYDMVTVSFNHVNPNASYPGEEFFAEYNFTINTPFQQITP